MDDLESKASDSDETNCHIIGPAKNPFPAGDLTMAPSGFAHMRSRTAVLAPEQTEMFKPPPTVILHLQDQFVAQLRVLGRTVDVSVGEIAECVLLLIDTGLLLLQRAQKALKSLNDEQRARLRHGVNFIHETVRERCELFGDPHGTI